MKGQSLCGSSQRRGRERAINPSGKSSHGLDVTLLARAQGMLENGLSTRGDCAMKTIIKAAAVFVLVLLASCRSLPERVALDRNAAGPIKVIGILDPSIPKEPMVWVYGRASPLMLLGFIGGMVDASIQLERGKKFHAELVARQFDLRSLLVASLTTELTARGYQVVTVPVVREKEGYLESIPATLDPTIDLVIDPWVVNYGYVATTITAPFRPNIALRYKGIRVRDKAVLVEDAVVISSYAKDKNAVVIDSDAKYSYKYFDRIMENIDQSIEGLREGIPVIAKAVAGAF